MGYNKDILKALEKLNCDKCNVDDCHNTLLSGECIQDFFCQLHVCDYCQYENECGPGDVCGSKLKTEALTHHKEPDK